MTRDELGLWLRLTLTPGVGDATGRRLLAAFGLPQQVFAQSETALRQVVSAAQAKALLSTAAELPTLLETTWKWFQTPPPGQAHCIAPLGDALYPASLLATEDPPLVLYMVGQIPHESTHHVLCDSDLGMAIVGSRNPTPQGALNARQFGRALAQSGLCVVSGLALGIDGAAHEGALEAQGNALATIAVVGTGLDRVYPKQHLDLARRIAQQGLLISEYPLGTPPRPNNFPKRNRLISALTQGTLVVEAALKSGSLITARLAVEQGKEVFAIPGSIHATQSQGCHALIKQGAKLVSSAQDILEELRMPHVTAVPTASPSAAGSDTQTNQSFEKKEDVLLEALGFDPVSLDALVARTGFSAPALQVQLLTLELDGQVARLPGGLFQRLVSV